MGDTFPLSLLSLPQLKIFSLSRNYISFDSLLDSNLPSNINRSDTNAVMEWLDEHFIFSNETEYSLLLNPICYENVSWLSPKVTEFLQSSCEFPIYISALSLAETSLCTAYILGNGNCDIWCDEVSLLFDMGDCLQLCFADEISNCSLSKLANNQCDPGCDNRYCIGFNAEAIIDEQLDFSDVAAMWVQERNGTLYAPDSYECPWNGSLSESEYPFCSAASTESVFIDPNIAEKVQIECDPSWIGDALCDDACRVSECANDGGDCDMQCTHDFCSKSFQIWTHWTGDEHHVNHTFGCNVVYPMVLLFFGLDDDVVNCTEQMHSLDFNHDDMMNYREFVAFGLLAWNHFDLDTRHYQLNCSGCSGME